MAELVEFATGFLAVIGAVVLLMLGVALVSEVVEGIKSAWRNRKQRIWALERDVDFLHGELRRHQRVLCTGWRFQEEGSGIVVAYREGEEPESFRGWLEAVRWVLDKEQG